jgi:DNA polymerase (family 10)
MVKACRSRGYRYCAITEHSHSLAMTRGFDTARVRKSVEEIAAVRRRFDDIQVLHGLEVDILADGALDLDDEGLALLDWVIVSIHSRLDQPADAATERVLRALDHPAVCAMGHPSGRLIGTRSSTPFDLEKVLERAAANRVAMEINAQPDRLDLNDVHARLAREKGTRLVIDTDAHSTAQLDYIRYGVFVARRAGLTRDDVLNTLPFDRFRAALESRRSSRGTPRAKGGESAARPATRKAPAARARRPAARPAAREAPAARARRPAAGGKRAPSRRRGAR